MSALDVLAEYKLHRVQLTEAIHVARREGATWDQIAEAAGMTRAGVIKRANQRQ